MSTVDPWHDGLALAPLSNKASTGSYDSVITMNSVCSEDSMEHLSAEERACIMYLEQTIEALEVQEDSGLSNDEPDSAKLLNKLSLNSINNTFGSDKSGMERRSEPLLTFPVGFQANKSVYITLREEKKDEDHILNQNYNANFTVGPEAVTDCSTAPSKFMLRPQLPITNSVTDRNISINPKKLCSTTIGGSSNIIHSITPDMELGLIPPPSDFMDDPVPDLTFADIGLHPFDPKPNNVEDPLHSAYVKGFYRRVLEKNPSVSLLANQKPPDKLSIGTRQSLPDLEPVLPVILQPDTRGPSSPPFGSRKAKTYPVSVPYQTQTSEANSPIANGESQLSNKEIIHNQALQKLGLLKDSFTDLEPTLDHNLSPQTRKSWKDLSLLSNPSLLRPSNQKSSYMRKSHASLGSTTMSSDILPVPSSLIDRARHRLSEHGRYSGNNVGASSMHPQVNSPRCTSSDLVKQLTRATAAQLSAVKNSDLQLRQSTGHHNRISVEKCLSHADSNCFRKRCTSHSALQRPVAAHILPRSKGVSAQISTQGQNEIDHREALKKRGLITD
ncbi:uncharacterized protein LOC144200930 [Stigmatopora nigra]